MVKGARPGCDAEALLGAGVADVDAPVVGAQLDAGDGGDGVGQQQGVALAGTQRGDVGADAGRGLGVDGGDDRRRRVGGEHAVDVDRLPPLVLDRDDLGAAPCRDVGHPLAEEAVDRDHDDVAGVDGVDERRLHAGRPGRAERQRAGVGGAPDRAEHVARLVHDPEELRVEVAEQRVCQGAGGLGVGVGGTGTEEVALADHGSRT